MRWLACLLSCVCGSWAAPVVVFDEVEAGDGWPAARLRVGGDAATGYRQLAPEALARCVMLTANGSVPLTGERPFGGTGRSLRLNVGAGVGWWSLDLPVPPLTAPRAALADGRLTIAIRGRLGGEAVELGLLDNAAPRHAVRLPLGRYGRVETGWTLYRIPLQDYLALAPDLAIDKLAAVQLLSARAEPVAIDLDHVLLEAGPLPPAPVRVVYEPAAAAPRTSPRSGPGQAPRGTEPTEARPVAAPPAAQPAAPALPPPVQQPTLPTSVRSETPPAAPLPAPGPPAPAAPVATRPAVTPPTPAAPAVPAAPPTPAAPAVPAAPPAPAAPAAPPATVPAAGPQPDSPVRPAGPVRLPDEVRPMLPVSFFFTEVVGGQDHWPASVLRASWATNQGERAFEPTELKDYFGLLAGDKLPVVTVAEPGRSGAVLKLEIKQAGFAWWTVQLGRANWETSDERPYLRNGRLELAVRGEVGEEAVRVGLVDAQETPEVAQVLLTRHATLTKDWQLVRVPLRELKAANPKLDWSRVKAVQIASAHGRPLTLYLDDIRIVNPVASED